MQFYSTCLLPACILPPVCLVLGSLRSLPACLPTITCHIHTFTFCLPTYGFSASACLPCLMGWVPCYVYFVLLLPTYYSLFYLLPSLGCYLLHFLPPVLLYHGSPGFPSHPHHSFCPLFLPFLPTSSLLPPSPFYTAYLLDIFSATAHFHRCLPITFLPPSCHLFGFYCYGWLVFFLRSFTAPGFVVRTGFPSRSTRSLPDGRTRFFCHVLVCGGQKDRKSCAAAAGCSGACLPPLPAAPRLRSMPPACAVRACARCARAALRLRLRACAVGSLPMNCCVLRCLRVTLRAAFTAPPVRALFATGFCCSRARTLARCTADRAPAWTVRRLPPRRAARTVGSVIYAVLYHLPCAVLRSCGSWRAFVSSPPAFCQQLPAYFTAFTSVLVSIYLLLLPLLPACRCHLGVGFTFVTATLPACHHLHAFLHTLDGHGHFPALLCFPSRLLRYHIYC